MKKRALSLLLAALAVLGLCMPVMAEAPVETPATTLEPTQLPKRQLPPTLEVTEASKEEISPTV